jgi:DNA-binding PadR family transcriptional regulator
MRKNEIDLMILGSLLVGPAHGYEIKRRIADSFGALYPNLSHSVLYPRLAQFEKEGFIKGKIELQHDAPNRKVYQLTAAGFKHFKALAATPITLIGSTRGTYADELAVHIVFFSLITKEERRKVIEPYYNIALNRYDDAVKKKYISEKLDKFTLAFLEYGVLLLKYTVELYEKLMEID